MSKTRPMAFITKPGAIEIREIPIPPVGPHDVLIRVKAASICGSDLHIYKGKHPAVTLPTSIGHELSGVVEQVGKAVEHIHGGERVSIEPTIACGKCYFCQRGHYHHCTNLSFQYRQGQGGFTSVFIAEERWVHPIPDSISFAEGALIEPLSVAVHAAHKSGLTLGESSAIFGAGAIGLLLLQVLQAMGSSTVFITDIQEHRLRKSLDLGAAAAFNNLTDDAVMNILQRTDSLGVDKAFEAVGIQSTLQQALNVLKKGGTAVLVGLFEQAEVNLPANIFVQKEITLMGSLGYSWDFPRAISLVENKRVNLKSLITHRFPLDELQKGFEVLLDPKQEAIKVVIEME